MNRDRLYGIWMQLRGNAKVHWGALVGDSLAVDTGNRECVAGAIQEQRGLSRQEADRQLEEFVIRNRNWQDLSMRQTLQPPGQRGRAISN